MPRIKIVSDIHTEFFNYNKFAKTLDHYFPPHEEDSELVLVCAGDIGTFNNYLGSIKPFFSRVAKRFDFVVATTGNHEYYSTSGAWDNPPDYLNRIKNNVAFYEQGVALYKGVWFLMAALWTDFDNANPIAMFEASRSMNDYHLIRRPASNPYSTVRLQPEDTITRHRQHVEFLERNLREIRQREGANAKIVVVTHQAPSWQSVGDAYKGSALNPAYASNLEPLMLTYRPQVWVHGHMHDSKDYMIEATRVICNPLGYHAQCINKKFNPHLVVEV